MKKQILSTSAIALGVAMAAPASAQEWNLDWGGFANTHVGISSIDRNAANEALFPGVDNDGVNIFTNSEIIFSPSVTLDNGMTFGFNVQMEALNGGGGTDGIDESYVTISSDTLGRIDLGSENSAGYRSMVAAPQVGSMAINSRSTSAFVPVTGSGGFRQAALSSYTEVGGNNDVQRITYFTPSFNGLTLGVSYAPSNAGNASNNAPVDFNSAANITDIFDVGVSYSQSFNGVDIDLGGRWGTGDSNVAGVSDPETWGLGAAISVSGFTFGVGYAENDNGAVGGVGDQEGLSVGVAYDIAGPWTVGLEGYFGEVDNGAGVDSSDYDVIKLAASRSLGAGVSWDVYYFNQETTDGNTGGKIEGDVVATAINLSF
ncbi:Outer membrane protein (porin) [Roseovarius tolerans]|uniref:Outer membrane protein (Porin) n=1 Tax=Roseovarius tolerans TaxID=74031 RepID=A0A1H8EHT3_9RHOB|nr:porin [Roseovarius tolerans]SEN19045.1 Outer membrane protein (porin) [Roseovarius tolerans]